jgi:hypothetical protein
MLSFSSTQRIFLALEPVDSRRIAQAALRLTNRDDLHQLTPRFWQSSAS